LLRGLKPPAQNIDGANNVEWFTYDLTSLSCYAAASSSLTVRNARSNTSHR
jgi:hypothetical protein